MADKEPGLTPEEQAAQDAHSAVNDAEQGWAGSVEARLAALEDKAGITKANEKADQADKEEK